MTTSCHAPAKYTILKGAGGKISHKRRLIMMFKKYSLPCQRQYTYTTLFAHSATKMMGQPLDKWVYACPHLQVPSWREVMGYLRKESLVEPCNGVGPPTRSPTTVPRVGPSTRISRHRTHVSSWGAVTNWRLRQVITVDQEARGGQLAFHEPAA
jgi:hypothetical protein